MEALNPTLIVSKALTVAITEATINLIQIYQQLFQPERNIADLAIKLNFQKKNPERCSSHPDFFSQYIQHKLFPKGLKLTLEHTISNYGQEFVVGCILK